MKSKTVKNFDTGITIDSYWDLYNMDASCNRNNVMLISHLRDLATGFHWFGFNKADMSFSQAMQVFHCKHTTCKNAAFSHFGNRFWPLQDRKDP